MSDRSPDALPDEPAFGLLDVIEAFTAMRHEFRTRSTVDRKLAEQLGAMAGRMEQLENRIQSSTDKLAQSLPPKTGTGQDSDSEDVRRLCKTLAEIDHHLSRTVQTAVRSLDQDGRSDGARRRLTEDFGKQIDLHLDRTGPIRRWLVGSWARQLKDSFQPPPEPMAAATEATVSALRMLRQRVARLMDDAGLERIDVTGKPFDANLMNAVESVASQDHPVGHVAQQLSPAYRWRKTGGIIRYAEVNVSSGD